MDDVKLKLAGTVAGKLSAAPASAAKDELVEELSDNLYRRFLDMTGAGVPEDEAFRRALDDLGDVDELLAYLGVEPAGDVTIDQREGQIRVTSSSGKTVVINNPGEGEPIIINGKPIETGPAPEEKGPQDQGDQQGGAHCDYSGGQTSSSELNAILTSVSEACNTAIDQARDALKLARDAIKRRTTVEKDKGRVKVHFNTSPGGTAQPQEPPAAPPPPPQEDPARHAPPPPPSQDGAGWEFEAELDSDQGRFFAGAGPKERKDVVYGFGYDKDRGGFFAQWGEYQEGSRAAGGPHFSGEDASMTNNDDGSYSVTALKDLRGIEVFTGAGDVTIHMSEAPDAGVIIDGDVDDLNVTCSSDGVLTIREGRTASSSFFSRRGFSSADVELYLPCRHWETITATTASGDVDVDRGELDVDCLTVTTASGDLSARLSACRVLSFKSASGDLDLSGSCGCLLAETMSGDISLAGWFEEATLKSASGDISLEGRAAQIRGSTMSGDISVDTEVLPQAMELSSKSGDCTAHIPDGGPFSLRMKTVSGEQSCEFPVSHVNGLCVYGDGSGPVYSMTSISGDVSLERR